MFQVDGDSDLENRPQHQWNDVRFIGALAGRYVFTNRPVPKKGKPTIYPCRTCSVSTSLVVISSATNGDTGEAVTAQFEVLGKVKGKVLRQVSGGLAIELDLDDKHRDLLASRIVWLKKRVYNLVPDKRVHKRVTPKNAATVATLADGTQIPCYIVDVSQSGIAVAASFQPEIGMPLAIGKAVGRVVRHNDLGFAVQFVELHQLETIDSVIAPPASQ